MLDHAEVRSTLLSELDTMLKRHKVLGDHLTNKDRTVPQDWSEQATFRENDEVLERLDDQAVSEIRQIRAALNRLDKGTYGVCGRCGEDIPEGRLKALPFALTCTGCAE